MPRRPREQGILAEADRLLLELGETERELDRLTAAMEAEVARLREVWVQRLAPLEQAKKRLEDEVLGLAKRHREELFPGPSWRVELRHGALLYEVERRVKRAKGMLEKLKEAGFLEAIRVAESVDWDRLESWPEERLRLVGTARVTKERYAYEVW